MNFKTEQRQMFGLLVSLLLVGCLTLSCDQDEDYIQFKKLSAEQQEAEFKRLPAEKQIDYYLNDQGHEPPKMAMDKAIARQGNAILPDLLKRLKAETKDNRRYHLIRLIETMHRQFLPLNEDRQVIDTVEQAVDEMKDPNWTQASRQSLNLIKARPDAPAPRPKVFP